MAALSVIYSNFCGMVVSETRNGVESDYISDPQGSTIGLMNAAGTMTDRWEYWPYGEVISHTGSSVTPLTFLGAIGYFQDVLSKLFYVRARHLRADLARWLTVDPLWPRQKAYGYVDSSPLLNVDPSGLAMGVITFGEDSTLFYNINIEYMGDSLPSMDIIIRLCISLDDYGIDFGSGEPLGALLMALAVLLGLIIAGSLIVLLNVVGAVLVIIFSILLVWGAICHNEFPHKPLIGMEFAGSSVGIVTFGTPWCCRC